MMSRPRPTFNAEGRAIPIVLSGPRIREHNAPADRCARCMQNLQLYNLKIHWAQRVGLAPTGV